MPTKHLTAAERGVPRYTSYPTAPHFVGSVRANTYAMWLEDLAKTDTLSLYIHVPFCEKICLYCGCHTKATRRIEPVQDYAKKLIQELDLVAKHTGSRRIAHLHWGGGTPSILGPDWLYEFVAQLDARFDLNDVDEHAFELDPRYVTPALADALAGIGVTRASLGVQDLSAHVQQAIGRMQPLSVVQQAVDRLRNAGISQINIDLMYGLPNQSVHDVKRTAMLVHQLGPQRLAVFGYAHVPWLKKHQRLLDEVSMPTSSARLEQVAAVHETLTSLGYEPVGLDHYAMSADRLAVASRTRTLHRNFQGYTTDNASALIGLGASAISRLPSGFAQNAADAATYSRTIASGGFATVRGLTLSNDDRIRGRIIEELMCHLVCDIRNVIDEVNGTEENFASEFAALTPFTSDGLAAIDGTRITINEAGRPYLRLIASTFDQYLANASRHSIAV